MNAHQPTKLLFFIQIGLFTTVAVALSHKKKATGTQITNYGSLWPLCLAHLFQATCLFWTIIFSSRLLRITLLLRSNASRCSKASVFPPEQNLRAFLVALAFWHVHFGWTLWQGIAWTLGIQWKTKVRLETKEWKCNIPLPMLLAWVSILLIVRSWFFWPVTTFNQVRSHLSKITSDL